MARHKDSNWNLPDGDKQSDGRTTHSWQSIHSALLMDIRDELKQLNRILSCPNFLGLPRDIARLRSEVSGIRRDLKKKSK